MVEPLQVKRPRHADWMASIGVLVLVGMPLIFLLYSWKAGRSIDFGKELYAFCGSGRRLRGRLD